MALQDVSFTNPAGKQTKMDDSTTTLACGGTGSISDWEAVYDQHWVCVPSEHGEAQLTITVGSPDTISIVDEDPPGSGHVDTYTATLVGTSAHAVKGYFDGGPVGNRYREHFTWTRRKDGGFSQWSTYTCTEGLNSGSGGICAASATRVP